MSRFSLAARSVRLLGVAILSAAATTLTAPVIGAQAGKPTITVSPATGEYATGQQLSVTVTYCDNNGLDTAGVVTQFNNVNVNWAKTYTIGNPGSCLARLVRSGTVTLVAGTNTLRASIEDTSNPPLWSGWSITTWSTPFPWTAMTIIPDNQFVEVAPSTATTQRFVVTNIGDATATFTFTSSSTGLTSVGNPSPTSASIAPGASQAVTINATSSATNLASGRVQLNVTGNGESGFAWTEITSMTPATLTNGVVLLNPTGILEKDLCLTIAAGPAAAMECGDLRLAHGLPGITTRNKGRAPTLVYSAQTAHPTPAIAADLSITSVVGGETYTATVVITGGPSNGTSFSAGSWTSADWGSSGKRRILATFDGSSLVTGRHPYRLDVQRSGGTTYSATGELLIVNRAGSPFNAGWWVAGLEQLVPFYTGSGAADTLLWVGGDGSARVYRETSATSCVFVTESLNRPDSIVATYTGGACTNHIRRLANSLAVVFDGTSGRHKEMSCPGFRGH